MRGRREGKATREETLVRASQTDHSRARLLGCRILDSVDVQLSRTDLDILGLRLALRIALPSLLLLRIRRSGRRHLTRRHSLAAQAHSLELIRLGLHAQLRRVALLAAALGDAIEKLGSRLEGSDTGEAGIAVLATGEALLALTAASALALGSLGARSKSPSRRRTGSE